MSSSLSEPTLGALSGDTRLPVGHHHPGDGRPPDLRGGSDLRGGDLVSRLLAATPPYLYSFAPPNTFFFSEMLRSFVHAKQPQLVDGVNAAMASGGGPTCAPTLPHHNRRPRKRSWRDPGQVKMPLGLLQPHGGVSPSPSGVQSDKPLELTTHRSAPPPPSQLPPPPPAAPPPPPPSQEKRPPSPSAPPTSSTLLPPSDPPLPSDLLLPPSQPLWYPPLYPLPGHQQPYGFDPLHFFIDLRVSGHILDRNKSAAKDEPEDSKAVKHTKHCSAFSVPQPRSHADHPDSNARLVPPTSTNYVMQNLSRIYEDVRTRQDRPESPISPPPGKHVGDTNNNGDEETKPVVVDSEKKPETEEPEKPEEEMTEEERAAKKAKDLRALIGLELVVDYVNHNEDGRGPKRRRCSSDADSPERSPVSSVSSKSRSRSPSPSPQPLPPPSPQLQAPPSPPSVQPPYLGQPLYHDFHHLPSAFLRERTDALNLQVRHH